jgi:hypothetical protein
VVVNLFFVWVAVEVLKEKFLHDEPIIVVIVRGGGGGTRRKVWSPCRRHAWYFNLSEKLTVSKMASNMA